MPVEEIRRLRPVHQFLKEFSTGEPILRNGKVQAVIEDLDDNDLIDGKYIPVRETNNALMRDETTGDLYVDVDEVSSFTIENEKYIITLTDGTVIPGPDVPSTAGFITIDDTIQTVVTSDGTSLIDPTDDTRVVIPVSSNTPTTDSFVVLDANNQIDSSLIGNLHITDVETFDTIESRNSNDDNLVDPTIWHRGDIAIVLTDSGDPLTGKGSYIYTGTNEATVTQSSDWSLLEVGNQTKANIDALGIDAATVSTFTVGVNVPADAVLDAFTKIETGTAISTAISTEVTDRNTAISTAISTEVTDRNTAISTAVSTEVTDRNTAISTAISTEVTDRNTAISTETTNRGTAISSAISTEVTDRNSAIGTAISTEVTDRNSAISTAISTEVTDRNTAIDTAVSTETTNRGTAISD